MALLIVLAVLAALIIAVLAWLIITYNHLVKLRNNVEEGFATMEVYLKLRFDLIPNLVEVVKHYTQYERTTLEAIVQGRAQAHYAIGMDERIQGEAQVTRALGRLFAVAENYPELRASEQYLQLQKELSSIEDDIASARRYYNGVVRQSNTAVQMFPTNIIASMFSFAHYPFFEVEDYERHNPGIQL
ncbi:MAG: LemA family protein [Actinomycetaceae bacterium]|nr:LemA family protein [Actinomycetaceae bacterium]